MLGIMMMNTVNIARIYFTLAYKESILYGESETQMQNYPVS
jgi:hypothetical protein